MSDIWNTLIGIQGLLEQKFNETGIEIQEPGMERFNQPGWVNRVWTSEHYRRAHIDVVDARETKGLWMMHCCIFPHTHNPAPIFGYDVIAGSKKITGCFHDFSPAGDSQHPLIDWFKEEVKDLRWKRIRPLPDWAEKIFTGSMIAAGNVTEQHELDQIFGTVDNTVRYYLNEVGKYNHTAENTTEAQDFYCHYQRKNPHTPKVMSKLGLDEDDVAIFIKDCLFPKIEEQR